MSELDDYEENRCTARYLLRMGHWGDSRSLSAEQRSFLTKLCRAPCKVLCAASRLRVFDFHEALIRFKLTPIKQCGAATRKRNLAKWLRSLPERVGQRSDGRYTLVLTKGQLASLSCTIPKVLDRA